ncbi:MAG: MFS transporter [Cellvibrionaceae bacterium]|nr:MFS transporter [Cellvibrionaceae bacterium]
MAVVSTPAMSGFERRAVLSLTSLYAFRMLGLFMVLPVLTLYGDSYPGSNAFLLGLALGVYGLTQALLQIPFGSLSDRLGRKPLIAFGLLLFAAGSVLAASAESVYGLIAGRALQGAGAIAGTIMALVGDLTAERNRSKAMASIGVAIGVAFALAIVLGPAIARSQGLSGIFWATAGLALVGLVILFTLVPNAPLRPPAAKLPLGQVLKDPQLQRLNIAVLVLHFALMASFVVVPGLLLGELEIDREQHWLVYLPVMLLSFIVMLPFIIWAEKKRRHKPLLLIACALLLLAEGLFALSGFWGLGLLAGLLIFFIGFNMLEASLPSLLTRMAPMAAKGAASGVFSTYQFFGTFAGGACGGYLLGQFGAGALFALCAVLFVALAWVGLGMSGPPAVSTLFVDVHTSRLDRAEAELKALSGVREVLLARDQAVASVRIIEAEFDEAALQGLQLDAPAA